MNSFSLDLRRQFNRRICSTANLRREWFELLQKVRAGEWFQLLHVHRTLPETWRILLLFSLPVVVAVLVMLAFMTSRPLNDDKFIFFSTLYAFWLGLFGSCQTLNGEVAGGEWSYWVLGHRLSFKSHLAAVAAASLVAASLQVACFVVTVVALDRFVMRDTLLAVFTAEPFTVHYAEDPQGMLTYGQAVCFAGAILLFALLVACTSGVCLGTLLSALFREPASSVRAAVVVIVFQAVISVTVLTPEGGTRRFPLLTILWSAKPRSAFLSDTRGKGDRLRLLGLHKGEALLEDLSLLGPQRYFYNLGGVFNRNVSKIDRNPNAPRNQFSLNKAFEGDGAVWQQITNWTANARDDRLAPTDKQFRYFAWFAFGRLMLPEITALLMLNTIYLGIACRKIQKGEHYHVLR